MKTGRPTIPEASRKTAITAVRLRSEERAQLESAAESRNMHLSDWMRETLLATAVKQLLAAEAAR